MDDLFSKALEEFQECKNRVDKISGAGPGVRTCGSVVEIEPRVLMAQEQASQKNAGPSSALPRERDDKDVVESAPEESSNVAENSHAMEIEESPQDVAKSLD